MIYNKLWDFCILIVGGSVGGIFGHELIGFMTDYRIKLLEFLENEPNITGNILPIIDEYLNDVGAERRNSFMHVIAPLVEQKFVVLLPEHRMGITTLMQGNYVHDNIIMRMTYSGLDYLNDLRRKSATS
jgi:hypothetical protein